MGVVDRTISMLISNEMLIGGVVVILVFILHKSRRDGLNVESNRLPSISR